MKNDISKRKRRMIMLYILMGVFSLILLTGLIGPSIYWQQLASAPINVWIVDKTVPTPSYREHEGLMWALNHYKAFSGETGKAFSYSKDYFGFMPKSEDRYDIRALQTAMEKPELIYLADTYGVYTDDLSVKERMNEKQELLYGGLHQEEIAQIKASLGEGNTIIGEFNIASAPTNQENRNELGKIFGLHWSGWKGRYFDDFAEQEELPLQIRESYERQTGQKWNFIGSGYVLVSDQEQIIVLQKDQHIGKKGLQISFNPQYTKEFAIKETLPYPYWFEFTASYPGREAIANYQLDVTEAGKKILDQIGLSPIFPAITRYKNTQYTAYYFAGDFADFEGIGKRWDFYGMARIKSLFAAKNNEDTEFFYWRGYVPLIKKILDDIQEKVATQKKTPTENENRLFNARATHQALQIKTKDGWKDFFVKGVNLGPALPGKWFTEFPEDEALYLHWFNQIGEMHANSIRIYTLLPPSFYNALSYYNQMHPNEPIWLLQEIWPEENPEDADYLKQSYTDEYFEEIRHVVDAIHGKANIPDRKGRASGVYTSNVSAYVLGYLVGRELEPEEVIQTNIRNTQFTFKGQYLSVTPEASAAEAWLAMSCDYVVAYEENIYKTQHPVAIVSWPTLDSIEHDAEWNEAGDKDLEYNDKVSIDIAHFDTEEALQAGFFGAYHIYPNYPDFMNNEALFTEYQDVQGTLRYGGYLKQFIQKHSKYPALVAEFGLATGTGNAHANPDGLHHGGLTEQQQGDGIVRMMKALQKEGYAGGVVFEWMDEWAKKTWITEPLMIPYERHVFWHNGIDPEQNYGLLALEPERPKETTYSIKASGVLQEIEMSHDAQYLYLNIKTQMNQGLSKKKLWIGLDTYDRKRGEFRYDPNVNATSPSGMEFIIQVDTQKGARLLVQPSYNALEGRYASKVSNEGIFEEIRPMINQARVTKDGTQIEAVYQEGSRLHYGRFDDNTYAHWYIEGGTTHLRIPWARLNFSDPSSLQVVDDEAKQLSSVRDQLKTVTTEGIAVSAVLVDGDTHYLIDSIGSEEQVQNPYRWETWGIPKYNERLKKSYYILKQFFNP